MELSIDERAPDPMEAMRVTAIIVTAFAANNPTPVERLPDIIREVHQAIVSLARGGAETTEPPKPAVPINKSVHDDYIICLNDGRKLKMLKRYLRATYSMSPDDYRKLWRLPADYPMVAPNYATRRSEFAKKIGLGRGVRRKG